MTQFTVIFIVTKSCQLRCKYCYLVGKNQNEIMDINTARKVVDYILENKSGIFNEDSIVLDFIGGEPLLEITLISEICDYFVNKAKQVHHRWGENFSIRITTNGLLYNSPNVQNFIKAYFDKIDISISIDGNQQKNDANRVFVDGSGSYSRIIENVKEWIRQFGNVGTKMVISHEDVGFVFESAKHLIELGISSIDMNTVVEDAWHEGDDIILERELIKLADYVIDNNLYNKINLYIFEEGIGHPLNNADLPIPCGERQIAVDSSGFFYTCLRFANFSLREKEARLIGSISIGIDKNRLRPYILANDETVSNIKCRNCKIATGCRWCPAENYDSSDTGTIFQRATFVCKMHHARVHAKNYYWYKLLNL